MQGIEAGKWSKGKPRQRWEKDIIDIYSIRWQQQAEWQRTGIDFARTFGKRRPEKDMLPEDDIEIV